MRDLTGTKPYLTRDPMVGALLTYLGYPSLRFEQVIAGEWEFVFDNVSGGIQEDVDNFHSGTLVADAQKLLTIANEYQNQMTAQRATPVVEQHVVERHTGNEEYSVSSVGAAAFLKCSGFTFLRAEQRPSSTGFIFADDGTARTYAGQFHAHGSVDAKSFYEAVQEIHRMRRNTRKPARRNEEAA